MKEKVIFISVLVLLLLIVLCIPIPKGTIEDGGSKVYHAVLYKFIIWNHLYTDSDNKPGIYHKTAVYFFPQNLKSESELWDIEEAKLKKAP